ncbi:MAG: hypothetical protein Q8K22_03915 [Rhodoferax sp.]|nr:hypothetical protein [Rhodoferax sp.]
MKRRIFLAGLGMGAMPHAQASDMSIAASDSLIDAIKSGSNVGCSNGAKFYRIIGIGGAGCNLLASMRTNGIFDGYGPCTELIAVDLCPYTLWHVDAANKTTPERAPIKTMAIAEFGSGRRVNAGRAAALRNREALTGIVTGADVVMLIAGLGSGTGSGVTPILAGLSRAAGAHTVVIAVSPFDFGGSIRQSENALNSLRSNADRVIHFFNRALGDELGDDATLVDVFAVQEQRISSFVKGLRLG